jgi:translin
VSSLRDTLGNIREALKEKEKLRENAQKDMRKATSLSKQSILMIHQKRFKEAEKLLAKAAKIISKLNSASKTNPNIIYGGLFNAALQEHAEAIILLRLVKESRFVTPKEINVPIVDYVLGLADVIGEYRRMTLDALREGEVEKSENCLKTMDEIYIELMAMDEAYMLIPGLRRKCDTARKIIEATRGDVTQEIRRSTLEKYLKNFEKLVRKRSSKA